MKHLLPACFFLLPLAVLPQKNAAYLAYIEKYSEIAVIQQQEHGIPASITLAQGILESAAGQARLALEANNHFGIKCHDWDGARIYHNDDRRNECFRKYRRALDSYEDHSNFLKSRSRYAFLFELKITDYKGWAHGLKKAGYATDPAYANKLISLIEEYELYRFDRVTVDDLSKKQREERSKRRTAEHGTSTGREKRASRMQSATGNVPTYTPHPVMHTNGLRYVIARAGDTYGSIADEFGLKGTNVAIYNDAASETQPEVGGRVYLQKKRKKAQRQYTTHTVQQGESLYSIAQQYGIRIVELYNLNQLPYDASPRVGQTLKLR